MTGNPGDYEWTQSLLAYDTSLGNKMRSTSVLLTTRKYVDVMTCCHPRSHKVQFILAVLSPSELFFSLLSFFAFVFSPALVQLRNDAGFSYVKWQWRMSNSHLS